MEKLILGLFMGLTLCVTPIATEDFKAPIPPLPQPTPVIVPKTTHKAYIVVKRVHIPTATVIALIDKVSVQSGYPRATIDGIVNAESQYNCQISKPNKNGTRDHCLFQINDIHIPEMKKMGLNIDDPEDNAQFAVILMKRNGLRDWNSSKSNWQ